MKKFTIVSNEIKDAGLVKANEIKDLILANYNNLSISICEMQSCAAYDYSDTDCIMVLGGDGTMLRVVTDTVKSGLPIIGINIGKLGFLTEVELDHVLDAVKMLMSEKYHIEERMMLDGRIMGKEDKFIPALNDIVLSRSTDMMLVGYRVSVNHHFLKDFYADGMIVSTPTGSTGYNMSAGGAIVEPLARLIQLTPICPHTLDTRSIILSAEDIVDIEVLPPKGDKKPQVGVYFDGRMKDNMDPGDKIRIAMADEVSRICRISDAGFLEVLNSKMNE